MTESDGNEGERERGGETDRQRQWGRYSMEGKRERDKHTEIEGLRGKGGGRAVMSCALSGRYELRNNEIFHFPLGSVLL